MRLAPSLAVLALCAAAAAEARAEEGLENGKIDVQMVEQKDGVPQFVVRAIVEVEPRRVWQVVSDCEHYKDRLPNIAESTLLWRKGDQVTCEVTIAVPFPMSNLSAVTEAIHTEGPDGMTRRWKLVHGDYELNEGSWEIRPIKGGAASLVTYKVHAKPKAWVPGFLKEMAQKKSFPEMIARLRIEAAKLP